MMMAERQPAAPFKRVPIFELSKQRNWVQAREAQIRFP